MISFIPGPSGGRPQTITCEYRNLDSNVYIIGPLQHYPVDYYQTSEVTIASDLTPNTEYLVTLVSDNDVTSGRPSYSQQLTVDTRGLIKILHFVDSLLLNFNAPIPNIEDFLHLEMLQ